MEDQALSRSDARLSYARLAVFGLGITLLVLAVRGGTASLAWSAAAAALSGPAVRRAVLAPSPRTVGPAVGALIRAIPALDGGIAGASGPAPAMLFLSMLGLTRWGRTLIPIT